MYAFERRVKEPHIGWFAVNPGTVYTDIARNNSAPMRYSFKALEVVRKYLQFKNFFFFQFLFTCTYVWCGGGGGREMTYLNGPPNPPLDLPAHLCSITHMYITLQYKAREMEKLHVLVSYWR